MPGPQNINPAVSVAKAAAQAAKKGNIQNRLAQQADAKADFKALAAIGMGQTTRRHAETLKNRKKEEKGKVKRKAKTAESKEEEEQISAIEKIDDFAGRFNRRNPELEKEILISLRNSITDTDSKEEILKKVRSFYADHFLADEALEFLVETTSGDLQTKIKEIKTELNGQYKKEITAGRNISAQARTYAKTTKLGSPVKLRSAYYNVIEEPRTALQTFEQLTSHFSYDQMKEAIKFLFHSLGDDLKSKGPSIEPALLNKLMKDINKLQSILWIFLFFKERMRLINSEFKRLEIEELPRQINFENIAKQYALLVKKQANVINAYLVFKTAAPLGIAEDPDAQIIVFSQMRDATRHTAPRFYQSNKSRLALQNAINEAINQLEEKEEESER